MIETKRLLIRHFNEKDTEECYQSWGKDRSLGQYMRPYPVAGMQQMKNLVQGFVTNMNVWVIVNKEPKKIVGYITVDVPYEQLCIGEIGYVIGEKFQKHGYAREAVSGILTEYLVNRNFYLMEAKCNETNTASRKLLEQTGFLEEGRLRGRRMNLLTGERNDLLVFSITREEFSGLS